MPIYTPTHINIFEAMGLSITPQKYPQLNQISNRFNHLMGELRSIGKGEYACVNLQVSQLKQEINALEGRIPQADFIKLLGLLDYAHVSFERKSIELGCTKQSSNGLPQLRDY